jgi:hypothetical protein
VNRNSLGLSGRYSKDIVTPFIGGNGTGISFNILTKKERGLDSNIDTATSTTKSEEDSLKLNLRQSLMPT